MGFYSETTDMSKSISVKPYHSYSVHYLDKNENCKNVYKPFSLMITWHKIRTTEDFGRYPAAIGLGFY